MTKPSLLQTLLRQPSQSYSTAPPSSYDLHSRSSRASKGASSASSVRSSSSRGGSQGYDNDDGRIGHASNWDWGKGPTARMGFGRAKGATASLRSVRTESSDPGSTLEHQSQGTRHGESEDRLPREGIRRLREAKSVASMEETRVRPASAVGWVNNEYSGPKTERERSSRKGKETARMSGQLLSYSEAEVVEVQPSRSYSKMAAQTSPPRSSFHGPPTISVTASTPEGPSRHYSTHRLDHSPPHLATYPHEDELEDHDPDSSLPYLSYATSPNSSASTLVEYAPSSLPPSDPIPSPPSTTSSRPKRRSNRTREPEPEQDQEATPTSRPMPPFGLFVVEEGPEQEELSNDVVTGSRNRRMSGESEADSIRAESVYFDAEVEVEVGMQDRDAEEARPETIYFEIEKNGPYQSLREGDLDVGRVRKIEPVPKATTDKEPDEQTGQVTPTAQRESSPLFSTPTPFVPTIAIPVGRVLTMDEFFGLAEATAQPSIIASPASVRTEVDSTTTVNSSEETISSPTVRSKSTLPQRLSESAASSPSSPSSRSSIVSSILSLTDLSTVPTDVTQGKLEPESIPYTRAQKGKARAIQKEQLDTSRPSSPSPLSGIVPTTPVLEVIPPPAAKKRHHVGEKRIPTSTSTRTLPSNRHSSYEVVASSKLTTANLVSSTRTAPSSAAQDTPLWLKNIRALGEPIEPLGSFKPLATTTASGGIRRSQSMTVGNRDFEKLRKEEKADRPGRKISLETMSEESVYSSTVDATVSRSDSTKSLSVDAGDNRTIRRRKKSSTSQLSATPLNSSIERFSTPTTIVEPIPAPIPREVVQTLTPYLPPASAGPASLDVARPRAVSLFSATSAGAKSVSGLSNFSVPLAPYRPIAIKSYAPQRGSMLGSQTLIQSSTAMNAVSVCAHAAAALQRSSFFGSSLLRRTRVESNLPPHLASAAFLPQRDLVFGMLKSPPTKLKSGEVLVEVLAVAVDQWDWQRAAEMATKVDGFGWVPGRSFCGRAMECGFDVSKVKKGDMVFGLADLKRSGALAELLVVDRDRICLAPECDISVEEIAALPLSGVAAVQIMQSLCEALPRGSKILILNGHEGVGNLCSQVAFHFRPSRDLWTVAQCPPTAQDGEAYCRATGASQVIMDEPLATINSLHESSFDVVIDTIGGRRLYDASRRVLHSNGHYITTIGDSPTLATPTAQFKTGIRSLRRTFFKKDNKSISYWAVTNGDDERESTRETLEKLKRAVEQSAVRPTLKRVIGFAEAAKAFEHDEMGCVVRVLEMDE